MELAAALLALGLLGNSLQPLPPTPSLNRAKVWPNWWDRDRGGQCRRLPRTPPALRRLAKHEALPWALMALPVLGRFLSAFLSRALYRRRCIAIASGGVRCGVCEKTTHGLRGLVRLERGL